MLLTLTISSAEAGTASNNGKFVGTGYNDTFFATAGTDTYDGSGGWVSTAPGTGTGWRTAAWTWSISVSQRWASPLTSVTAAQATGFNTSTFTNIEGFPARILMTL